MYLDAEGTDTKKKRCWKMRWKETDRRQIRTVDEDVLLAEGEQVVVSTSPTT